MTYKFIIDYSYVTDKLYCIEKGTIVEVSQVIKYKYRNSVAVIYNPLLNDNNITIPLLDLMFCAIKL